MGLPGFLEEWWGPFRWVWYFGFGVALAMPALGFALFGLIRRRPMPWTHGLGLALALWPVLPLLGILLLSKK